MLRKWFEQNKNSKLIIIIIKKIMINDTVMIHFMCVDAWSDGRSGMK